MKIVGRTCNEQIASVYLAQLDSGKLIEFVESAYPSFSSLQKWVIVVSTLVGCPVGCTMCDAGGYYHGRLTEKQILDQIDCLVKRRFSTGPIRAQTLKIQFCRMGEPSFNPAVLDCLKKLPHRYQVEQLVPSLSSVAPLSSKKFFDELYFIKTEFFSENFQLQFSIHTTDENLRDLIIPVKKTTLKEIAEYGERFFSNKGRKISLNFALAASWPRDASVLARFFNPSIFLIKTTPLNPTYQAKRSLLKCSFHENEKLVYNFKTKLEEFGFEVIVSVGNFEENGIGSNCGQSVQKAVLQKDRILNSYTYELLNGKS